MRRNLVSKVAVAIICVAVLITNSPLVFAAEPHEDPDAAEQVFGGISLLRYYSEALDLILQRNPAGFEAHLEKMPFTNMPPSIKEASDELAQSAISISYLLTEIDGDMDKLRKLREHFRFDEATELAGQIRDNLSAASNGMERVVEEITTVGEELKISSAPAKSELRRDYDEVLENINMVIEMTVLYNGTITDSLTQIDEMRQLLKPTSITLAIESATAFVGDNIYFEGVLTSGAEPLVGREVDILANSSRYLTVRTDAFGRYQGTLQVPYWYIPNIDLQALYYPQDGDKAVYQTPLSSVLKLKVLFYKGELEITVEDKTYPGLETVVNGRFDYGQSPPLNERRVEIYVDNVLTSEFMAQETFSQEIKIDPEIDIGKHDVTVSSPAVGRYAPVDASTILSVTRAIPILDLSIPKVVVIPGSVRLEGKIYSEDGPLSEASIKMGLGKSRVESVSSPDGAFNTKIKVGMGLSMIGRQDLVILVLPREPWQAPLNITGRILIVNAVNCGIFIALILLLGIYLPGGLKRRLRAYSRTTVRPATSTVSPEVALAYSEAATILASTEEGDEASTEPRNRIFYWYRLAVGIIQEITKALLKPQQTLREFAKESSKILGPVAKYFIEITRIVERLLYSPYKPTKKDVEISRGLSDKIEEANKLRATTEALLARQLLGEGIGGTREFEFGDRSAKSGPWRQPATWLRVLLILAVAYYACILLFLLPLVVS
ncbi:hypothetical protein ACFLV4_02140 [Chloroflexota bacterium]